MFSRVVARQSDCLITKKSGSKIICYRVNFFLVTEQSFYAAFRNNGHVANWVDGRPRGPFAAIANRVDGRLGLSVLVPRLTNCRRTLECLADGLRNI